MTYRNGLLAAAAAACVATAGFAQDYPSKPITIIHGSQAGAPQDGMLRELAQSMERVAGVSVVVEPRPGGSGQVAMARVRGQAPDGYTIFSDGTGITAILQMEGAAYSLDDFRPLYRIQLDPFALYVNNESKFQSVDDFVQAMRDTPEEIRVGGFGTGTPFHFIALSLAEGADTELNWVPYSSGADAITAVMAGDLDVAISNISVYGRFRENTKILAVSSADRVAAFDHIPTFLEQDYPIERYHWRGMLVDSRTPDDLTERLHTIVGEAVASPEFQEYLAQTSTLDGGMTLEEYQQMLDEQAASDRAIMIKLGMIGG